MVMLNYHAALIKQPQNAALQQLDENSHILAEFPTARERSSSGSNGTGPLSGERAVNLRPRGCAVHHTLMRKTTETRRFCQPAVSRHSRRCAGLNGHRTVRAAGALPPFLTLPWVCFVSKGYTLVEAAPLLFVVTSGRASRWISRSHRRCGEVHRHRCFAAGWRSLSRRKRSRGTTSGTWSKVRHRLSRVRFVWGHHTR